MELEKIIEEQKREIEKLKKEKASGNKVMNTITLLLSLSALMMDLVTIFRLVKVNYSITKK